MATTFGYGNDQYTAKLKLWIDGCLAEFGKLTEYYRQMTWSHVIHKLRNTYGYKSTRAIPENKRTDIEQFIKDTATQFFEWKGWGS